MGKQNTLSAEVPEGTKSVDIYPTAMSSNATVKVNGTSVSGGKVSVDLNNGYKEITIEVTAPDGTTKKTYALIVRTHIDPANPYATLYTGEHTETVTLANGETRTFTSYVPEGARESCAGVFVLRASSTNGRRLRTARIRRQSMQTGPSSRKSSSLFI